MTTISTSAPQAEKAAIIEAVKLLHPGRVVELRVLQVDGRQRTASGYFDQPRLLAEAALRSSRAEGVYITLNPLLPGLLGRANNHLSAPARHTTSDSDVQWRAWLPLDLDPRRPSGISASEAEHQAALERARALRDWLSTEWGWHAPIFADSGNGAHLLYAIDLPNDAQSTALLKRVLAVLADWVNTQAVALDQSVFNAARIWKLYGTVARKGESLPERPHRLAQIISAPDPLELVTREQLETLADAGGPPAGPAAPGAGLLPVPSADSEDDLLGWLERHGAKVRQTKREAERTVYVLEQCPFVAHHAPGKASVTRFDNGALSFTCLSADCAQRDWQALKALWGDGPADVVAEDQDGGTGTRVLVFDAPRPWPEAPRAAVYHGLAGEIVQSIMPYSEADPLALLVQLLTAFGAAIGHGPHFSVGLARHEPRLYTVVVGESAKARKGDSWQAIAALLSASGEAPPIQPSLSSGEGLVWMVRDPLVVQRFIEGKRGQQGHYEQVTEDAGVEEKRVLIKLGELAQGLKAMRREGNTLSAILRDAWDQGNLSIATKTQAARATGAYVSLIAHITADELRQELRSLDAANGFANRFCWFAAQRSAELPDPEPLPEATFTRLAARLGDAIRQARQIGRMRRDEAARAKWHEMYHDLSRGRRGFVGALLSRSEAQVLRLSLLYALLDGSPLIRLAHLAAATELWAYAQRSVEYLFGSQSGSPLADRIAALLQHHGELSRNHLYDLLGKNVPGREMSAALALLAEQGQIAGETRQTGGRPAQVWRWTAQ